MKFRSIQPTNIINLDVAKLALSNNTLLQHRSDNYVCDRSQLVVALILLKIREQNSCLSEVSRESSYTIKL